MQKEECRMKKRRKIRQIGRVPWFYRMIKEKTQELEAFCDSSFCIRLTASFVF